MRSLALALAALFLLTLAPLPEASAQGAANRAPVVGAIVATLQPPVTRYHVDATDADGDTLTYTWSNSNACGRFVPTGADAVWHHGDDTNCGHDSPNHPGTITVRIADADGSSVVRTYTKGSSSGTGRDSLCPAENVEGAFTPSQGVWPDDEVFADKPGKKLLRVDGRNLVAELDMVVGRHTALFGVRGARDTITLKGFTTGTTEAEAIVRFTLKGGGLGEVVLHEEPVGKLRIQGDCGEERGFAVEVPAATGIPSSAFRFTAQAPYTIVMELVEKGAEPVPETSVTLEGFARQLQGLRIHVHRAIIANDQNATRGEVTRIADEIKGHATDYFPLAPGAVTTSTNAVGTSFARYLEGATRDCDDARWRGNLSLATCQAILRRVALEGYFAGILSTARADRVAVIASRPDFDLLSSSARAQAFTAHSKVVFARPDSDHWDVMHEIAHTLVRFPWADAEMSSACGAMYHNTGTFGNGVQLASGAAEARARKDTKAGLMGPVAAGKDYWIEQCEYWHLIQALQRPRDPPLLALRGFVLQNGGESERGALLPGLSLDGEPDLATNDTGAYALVLKDAQNATLATYRFDLAFQDDWGTYLPGVGFAWRVPDDPLARGVSLEGPTGELAWQAIAAAPPTVQLLESAVEGDEAVLRWSSSAPGLAWVVATDAEGNSWPLGSEVEGTELRVAAADVRGATTATVVVAVDGRAANATAPLVGAPPPTPPPAASSPTPPASPGARGPDDDVADAAPTPGPGLAALLVALLVASASRRWRRAR